MNIKKVLIMLRQWVEQAFTNFWTFFVGIISSFFGYFLPLRDMVNLMILFFIIDVIFGYWAARKTKGERFKVSKIWEKTIPRMVLSILVILLAFLWEDVFYGVEGNSYRVIGGFISGILLVSIAQNGYRITNWEIFDRMASFFKNKDKLK